MENEKIGAIYGDVIRNDSTVRKWFARFRR